MIEEGFIEFRKTNNQFPDIFHLLKKRKSPDFVEIEKSILKHSVKFEMKYNLFVTSINLEEKKLIAALQKHDCFSIKEAQQLTSMLANEMSNEKHTTLKGQDVDVLPPAINYFTKD